MSGKLAAFERAFSVEYTAIILIVLSFVIATFARAKMKPISFSQTKLIHSIGAVEIKQAFRPGSARPEKDNLEALVSVLRSHDLGATIWIGAGVNGSDAPETDLRLSLARAAALTRYLAAQSIPVDALNLQVLEGQAMDYTSATLNVEDR